MTKSIVKEIKSDAKKEIAAVKQKAKADIAFIKKNTLEKLASADVRFVSKQERAEQRAIEAQLPKRYTIGEEIANSVTHGIGVGLSIAGLVVLIIKAVVIAPAAERAFYITSFSIYGASLIIMHLMSTLYHALTPYGVKKVFAVFDHSAIYLLIAGTYTPFCLIFLRGTVGWWIFGVIWGSAILGITLYAIYGKKMRLASVFTYIAMGWVIVFAIKPLKAALPLASLYLLVWGGIAYTVGVAFYALKKVRWTHSIWHIFVMAGAILHFFSIYYSF